MPQKADPNLAENMEITLDFNFGEKTGIYTREWKDGLLNGKGKFITQNMEGIT